MVASAKRLLPVDLLRRSSRLQEASKREVSREQGLDAKRARMEQKSTRIKLDPVGQELLKYAQSENLFKQAKKQDVISNLAPIATITTTELIPKQQTTTKASLQPQGFLDVDSEELNLERTLLGGQSFRWSKEEVKYEAGITLPTFTGVVGHHALQLWRCDEKRIAFRKLNKSDDRDDEEEEVRELVTLLQDYFQLKYNLKELYRSWSARDKHLEECCRHYTGFRILRQDPVENVFSFICATNNNIKRISQMIDKLCRRFGNILEARNDSSIYNSFQTFPSVERLAQEDVFDCLRYELGFGYRAKFIVETAKQLIRLSSSCNEGCRSATGLKSGCEEDLGRLGSASASGCPNRRQDHDYPSYSSPADYLLALRGLTYKESCKQLMQFPGIGRKVADCICLMSMDHLESVPIDCHIYEIVCRNYMPKLRQERKTLTENVHDLIGDYFKQLHGPLAGWSTSVLFVAELRHLKQSQPATSCKAVERGSQTARVRSSK